MRLQTVSANNTAKSSSLHAKWSINMKPSYMHKLAVAAGLLLASVPAAYAAPGTAANTTVTNTVNVDYSVGGTPQTQIQATRNFKVDRKVNLIVVNDDGAAVDVVPNSTDNVVQFTVTNETNDTLDIRLTATQQVGGTAVYGGTDTITAQNVAIWLEDGTTAGFQSAEDTLVSYIDEIAAGATQVVYIVGDIDAGETNGDIAGVQLTAIAAGDVTTSGTGAYTATGSAMAADLAETNTGSADAATFVDTVFADTSTADGNTAENGQQYARGQFDVVTAAIAVTKTSLVASDPINGASNPKAIPGAVIEYCIDVNNTGSADAGSISIGDLIPTNTTFVSGSIKSAATGTGAACDLASGTVEDDNTTGVDDTAGDAGSFDVGTDTVTVTTATIAAGSRFKATFRVTVD